MKKTNLNESVKKIIKYTFYSDDNLSDNPQLIKKIKSLIKYKCTTFSQTLRTELNPQKELIKTQLLNEINLPYKIFLLLLAKFHLPSFAPININYKTMLNKNIIEFISLLPAKDLEYFIDALYTTEINFILLKNPHLQKDLGIFLHILKDNLNKKPQAIHTYIGIYGMYNNFRIPIKKEIIEHLTIDEILTLMAVSVYKYSVSGKVIPIGFTFNKKTLDLIKKKIFTSFDSVFEDELNKQILINFFKAHAPLVQINFS